MFVPVLRRSGCQTQTAKVPKIEDDVLFGYFLMAFYSIGIEFCLKTLETVYQIVGFSH